MKMVMLLGRAVEHLIRGDFRKGEILVSMTRCASLLEARGEIGSHTVTRDYMY